MQTDTARFRRPHVLVALVLVPSHYTASNSGRYREGVAGAWLPLIRLHAADGTRRAGPHGSRVDPGARRAIMGVMNKVNLAEKLALFSDHWNPKVVGELNGQQVKLVKFKGPFTWHHHDTEDEMFLVVKGRFRMELRDRNVELAEGEFIVVPRGVEHRPVADEEVHVLLFEPATTLNTGNVVNERTVSELERLVCPTE
jgi:mannose-6-phosphate isomerase-like protein (cupin superfamily)